MKSPQKRFLRLKWCEVERIAEGVQKLRERAITLRYTYSAYLVRIRDEANVELFVE
jgi:hypothetical protein